MFRKRVTIQFDSPLEEFLRLTYKHTEKHWTVF